MSLIKPENKRLNITDYALIAVVTLVAAVIAFTYLGSTKVPESGIKNTGYNKIVLDIGDSDADTLWLYEGIGIATLTVSSADELDRVETFDTVAVTYGTMYRWNISSLNKKLKRYVTISYYSLNTEILELALADSDGNIVDEFIIIESTEGAKALFDEQSLIPESPSLMTGMYFDELYHARTALEFIRGDVAYETTHPPLGKIMISMGIRLFGMNPFGWRVVSAVFSVLIIPLFYIFVFKLLRSSFWAFVASAVFTLDGMRIVMGRIATLDSMSVFFILLSYLFMYIFYTNFNEKFIRRAIPLALAGISFGISAAIKWTGVYSGAGLFIILMLALIKWLSRIRESGTGILILDKRVLLKISEIFVICLVFFIIIPFVIYLLSYIPFRRGLSTDASLIKVMWENQQYMYNFHSGLDAGHPYSSMWYQWLFNAGPVYFYNGELMLPDNMTARIFAFGNFAAWIGGLIAITLSTVKIIELKVKSARERKALSDEDRNFSENTVYLLIMYFSMLVPWMFIDRVVFMYHYYGCVPAFIAVTALLLQKYANKGRIKAQEKSTLRMLPLFSEDGQLITGRIVTGIYLTMVILIFVICYPLFTGMPVKWPLR